MKSWQTKEAVAYRKNRKVTQPGLIEMVAKEDPRSYSYQPTGDHAPRPNRADYRAGGYHGSGDNSRTVGDTVATRLGGGPRIYTRRARQVMAGALANR